MLSKNALVTALCLLVPLLYLQVPTLVVKGYYKFVLKKPIVPRPFAVKAPPSVSMNTVLKNTPNERDYIYGPLSEEDQTADECAHGLVLLTGATGSVGSKAAQLLLAQGFCVRIYTESIQQARAKWSEYESMEYAGNIEFVEGLLGDGSDSMTQAFEPRETSGYASVTHVLFAAASNTAGNNMDAVHHRGVQECAQAAAQAGTVQSMVVMSAAWVSKPYSLASLLYNGLYDNLPSAKHYQGEDALRTIAQQQEHECGLNETTSSVPLNYVILRSGRLTTDTTNNNNNKEEGGIGFAQDDSFDFWGPAGAAPGMSHLQLAQAAVAALQVKGKYTVEVTSGPTSPNEATKLFSRLLQDDEHSALNFNSNQTVTMQDVEWVHAQAMTDFVNVIFTLIIGTALLVALLGPGQGLMLSMSLYVITIFLWKTFLSDRTVWDCLESEMPRKLPLLEVPGGIMSFGIQS